MNSKIFDLKYNPFLVTVGDVVTAANKGVHEIIEISYDEEKDMVVASYNQLYTEDGKQVTFYRPASCDVKLCKSAKMLLPGLKTRVLYLQNLIKRLEVI